jgi:hypothetical protein
MILDIRFQRNKQITNRIIQEGGIFMGVGSGGGLPPPDALS